MATLFHWDLPQAAAGRRRLGVTGTPPTASPTTPTPSSAASATQVPIWLTVNEPKTVVQNGYLWGHHAPGRQDPDAAYLVAHHLQLAHGLAVRRCGPPAAASPDRPGAQPAPVLPGRRHRRPRAAATRLYDGYENRLYLDPIFTRRYPADVLADLGPDSRLAQGIRDGDLEIISSPVDLLAVQYYTPDLRHRRRRHRAALAHLARRTGSRSTPRACTTS